MVSQMKLVDDSQAVTVSALASGKESKPPIPSQELKQTRECWNCGWRHEYQRKELCPAYGKMCRKCRKPNHFAAKCRSRGLSASIKSVEERENTDSVEETFPMEVSAVALDDSQLVTLRLESSSHIRFQADTGAQCNVVPLEIYKKATKDLSLTQMTAAQTRITAYGGTVLPVVGNVLL